MRLLQWLREDFDVFVGMELALMRETVVAPSAEHDVDRLAEAVGALFRGNAKIRKLDGIKAAPCTPIDASS